VDYLIIRTVKPLKLISLYSGLWIYRFGDAAAAVIFAPLLSAPGEMGEWLKPTVC
jgi:hypothetical protein